MIDIFHHMGYNGVSHVEEKTMTPDFTNFRTEIDGVKVMVASGATVGINICHWIDVHAPNADYDEQTILLDAWLQKHNFMYYGSPKECFNECVG